MKTLPLLKTRKIFLLINQTLVVVYKSRRTSFYDKENPEWNVSDDMLINFLMQTGRGTDKCAFVFDK